MGVGWDGDLEEEWKVEGEEGSSRAKMLRSVGGREGERQKKSMWGIGRCEIRC